LTIANGRKNTDDANNTESESLAGIYTKLEIYCIRFALILELLQVAASESETVNHRPRIGTRATEGAIQITEYFRQTARRVNSILNNTPVEGLDTRKKSIYHLLPAEFSTDKGLQIAYENHFPERTFKRFLSDGIFFEKLEHGKYKKRH